MKNKITCPTCNFRFEPTPQERYTAVDPPEDGIYAFLTGGQKRYDAFDCPACGCQVRVGMRFPRSDIPDPIVEYLSGEQEEQEDE